jgi:uncharacterized protein DUF6542
VTATRDRRSDLEDDDVETTTPWDERPIIGTSRGLPWWAAVLLAFGLAAIAAYIDMQRQDSLGRIYQGAYVLGCVGAVCWVRRRNLFGPMVQPPLVFAITAIVAVVWFLPGGLGDTGLKQMLFSVALPLTSNFPTMAVTTGVTVVIGVFRLWRERNPYPEIRRSRAAARGEAASDGRGGRRERLDRDAPDRDAPPRAGRSRGEPDRDRAGGRLGARERRAGRNLGENGRESAPRGDRGRSDQVGLDRGGRADRGRGGQPDPARRRDPGVRGGRLRRDDRGTPDRRDGSDRGAPARQPRRRPPEDYR